jgi:fibronectin type 3 domain-containing protein
MLLLVWMLLFAPLQKGPVLVAMAHSNDGQMTAMVYAIPLPQGAATHKVVLTWTAPNLTGTSCVLSGYNVKRSATSGTEATIGTSPAGTTTYTDTNVSAGQKLFYVVTATNSATTCGAESAPSNEVAVTIPLDQIPAPTGLAAAGE